MLKINAGFSRKIGEPNFGSRGASVNVELELESGLIAEPDALAGRIRKLFDLARQSVDDELAGEPQPKDRSNNGSAPNGRDTRTATSSQIRAIRAICDRHNLDAARLAIEKFRVHRVEDLTVREASALIDELKSTAAAARNGGGR